MTKTHSFSIFLLKEGSDAANSLKDDNPLQTDIVGDNLPEGAVLFVLDNPPRPPWWKSFFGLQKELSQVSKGSLVFLPVDDRWFALSFGHVSHNLKDASYEYDFGLRVTLNCVDPDKLKSTDIVEPSGAKRKRTQLPTDSDLTYFDFDRDSTILKSLTGKVKVEYKELFKHATGASNIRVSSDATPAGLTDLCSSLLKLYNDDAYKTAFPDIQNIAPVRDPVVIDRLNINLLAAVHGRDDALSLSVPEILDYNAALWGGFSGAGISKIYDDIFIKRYFEYLDEHNVDVPALTFPDLKRHGLVLSDENGETPRPFSLFKCLIFDTTLDDGKRTFHLCEGNWYLIDADYVAKLTAYLDPLCEDTTLPAFAHQNEGEYNEQVSGLSDERICLDKTNFSPNGQKQLEPCDIFELADSKAMLHHIKISTLSAQLSHLFNQGTNSVRLFRSEAESKQKLIDLVSNGAPVARTAEFVEPLTTEKIKVVFGIITHKDKADKSLNLPLFSRISLMRCMKDLRMMNIEAAFCFIEDQTAPTAGKKKPRKPKGQGAAA